MSSALWRNEALQGHQMARSLQCIDARAAFAARANGPVKFPAFAPNMLFLRDLCSGLCQAWTERRPLLIGAEKVPISLQRDLRAAIERNVQDVTQVAVTPSRSGLLILVETAYNGTPFTFGCSVSERWLKTVEKTPESGHRG